MRIVLHLIAAMLLPLAGCGLLSSRPFVPVRYYSIDPPSVERRPEAPPGGLVLAVHTLGCAPRYRERILFRKGAPEGTRSVGYHENDRWVESPADMVTAVLRRALDAEGVARVVTDERLVRRPDLLLDGRITRFDEVQREPRWLAECEAELILKEADDGGVVFATRFAASREARSRTTAAVAEAMNAAVADLAAQAADAIRKALAGPSKDDRKP